METKSTQDVESKVAKTDLEKAEEKLSLHLDKLYHAVDNRLTQMGATVTELERRISRLEEEKSRLQKHAKVLQQENEHYRHITSTARQRLFAVLKKVQGLVGS